METQLASRAPQLRCRDCGTAVAVDLLCHHCGRAVCPAHAVLPPSAPGVQVSQEFAGLDLDGVEFVHCGDCHHVVKGGVARKVYLASIGAAVLGLVLIGAGAAPVGVFLLLAGIAVGVYSYFEDARRKEAMLAARPPLPVVPGVENIEIVEQLHGTLLLKPDGEYETQTDEATGRISIRSAFGRPDLERLEAYRRRFAMPADADVDFHAGFLALRGMVGVELPDQPADPTVRPLYGKIAEQPYLASGSGLNNGQWQIDLPYRLAPEARPRDLPLWLTPSLTPEQDQRSLELELQWTAISTRHAEPLRIDSVERLRLLVPISWGNVEKVSWASSDEIVRVVSVGTDVIDGETWRVVEWTKSRVTPQEVKERRLTVSVRFEHQVNLKETVYGSLELLFRNTFSGLTGVEVFHPLGGPRRNVRRADVATRIGADFELSLNHVRYQDVRKVPDHNVGEDAERRGREKDAFAGVIPDHETIIQLTNAISADGYYVKRVIENPPRGTGMEGNSVNRAWDIAGRRYDKVYPMDFQITLTGEEVHRGGIRASDGSTSVALTVNGTYTSESMQARIANEWDRLHGRIVAVLEEIQAEAAAAVPRQRDAAPIDEAAQMAQAAQMSQTMQSPYTSQTPHTSQTPQSPQGDRVRDGDGPRASSRHRRLIDLLLSGQISEELYQELKGQMDEHLDEA